MKPLPLRLGSLVVPALVACCAFPGWLPAPEDDEAVGEAATDEDGEAADQRPFLGVDVRPENSSDFDGSQGLRVTRVFPGTTAADLGLEPGDILLTFNGVDLGSRDDLRSALGRAEVGSEISATWRRADAVHSGIADLGSRKEFGGSRAQIKEATEEYEKTKQALDNTREDIAALRMEQAAQAMAYAQLAQALQDFPEKLQQAADEFRAAYPEGEFEVEFSISIKTHPDDEQAMIDLSPPAPGEEDEDGRVRVQGAEDAEGKDEVDIEDQNADSEAERAEAAPTAPDPEAGSDSETEAATPSP